MAFPKELRDQLARLGHPTPSRVPVVNLEAVADIYKRACRADLMVVHGKPWHVGCFAPGTTGAVQLRRQLAVLAGLDLDDRAIRKGFDEALKDKLGTSRPMLCKRHFGALQNMGALATT